MHNGANWNGYCGVTFYALKEHFATFTQQNRLFLNRLNLIFVFLMVLNSKNSYNFSNCWPLSYLFLFTKQIRDIKFVVGIVLLQFLVHFYRVFYGSCLVTQNEYDRCNRLWTIRSLAHYFGFSPSFDPACFPVFIDQPIFYEALSEFGNTSRGHYVCQIALECHNTEMRQGFCTPKRKILLLFY